MQPRSLEVLAGLDVSETLVDRGNETVGVEVHARGRTTTLPLFDIVSRTPPSIHTLSPMPRPRRSLLTMLGPMGYVWSDERGSSPLRTMSME